MYSNLITIGMQFSLTVADPTCLSITHWCMSVTSGEGGYFLENYKATLPVRCFAVTSAVLNCAGNSRAPESSVACSFSHSITSVFWFLTMLKSILIHRNTQQTADALLGLPIVNLALESSVPAGVIAGVGTDIVFTWSWDQGSGMTCDLNADGSAIGTQWIQV